MTVPRGHTHSRENRARRRKEENEGSFLAKNAKGDWGSFIIYPLLGVLCDLCERKLCFFVVLARGLFLVPARPISYLTDGAAFFPVSSFRPQPSIQQVLTDIRELTLVDEAEALFELVDHAGNGLAAGAD